MPRRLLLPQPRKGVAIYYIPHQTTRGRGSLRSPHPLAMIPEPHKGVLQQQRFRLVLSLLVLSYFIMRNSTKKNAQYSLFDGRRKRLEMKFKIIFKIKYKIINRLFRPELRRKGIGASPKRQRLIGEKAPAYRRKSNGDSSIFLVSHEVGR